MCAYLVATLSFATPKVKLKQSYYFPGNCTLDLHINLLSLCEYIPTSFKLLTGLMNCSNGKLAGNIFSHL